MLVAIEKTGDRKPKRLVIKFKNPEHGRLRREKNPCHRHPGATYIDPILWRYILGGATATILQFPVRGAAAISAHKFQVFYFDIKLASLFLKFSINARNFIKILTSKIVDILPAFRTVAPISSVKVDAFRMRITQI